MQVQKAVLADPTASVTQGAPPAELLDARQRIASLTDELQRARQDVEKQSTLTDELQREITQARADAAAVPRLKDELAALSAEVDSLRSAATRAASLSAELEQLRLSAAPAPPPSDNTLALQREADELRQRVSQLEASSTGGTEELDRVQRENEDLLVLLDDLSTKRERDKARMRESGWDVSEDEPDE